MKGMKGMKGKVSKWTARLGYAVAVATIAWPARAFAFGGSCALGATQLMTTLFPMGGALF